MAKEVDVGALTCGMPDTTQRKLIARKIRRQAKRHCANRQCRQVLSIHNTGRFCSLCKQQWLDSKTTAGYHLADLLESQTERTQRLKQEAQFQER